MVRTPLARRNDRDHKMDSGAAANGDLDAPQSPAILAPARNITMKYEKTTLLGTGPYVVI